MDKQVPAHVERMIEEHAQLDDRTTKLQAFVREPNKIFEGLAPKKKARLIKQLEHMEGYRWELAMRISEEQE